MLPTVAVLARPSEPAALLMVATAGLLEAQVTCVVRFCVELSEKIPVAVNCWLTPLGVLGLAGVTWIDTKVALVTVRVVLPEMLPLLAVRVVVPVLAALASPAVPAVLLTLATVGLEEDQVTCCVRSSVELSENTPVAMNGSVSPLGRLGLVGVTWMETSPWAVTVKLMLAVEPEKLAEIVTLPGDTAETSPPELTVATALSEDHQLAWEVTSVATRACRVAAVNCRVVPAAACAWVGVISSVGPQPAPAMPAARAATPWRQESLPVDWREPSASRSYLNWTWRVTSKVTLERYRPPCAAGVMHAHKAHVLGVTDFASRSAPCQAESCRCMRGRTPIAASKGAK